MIIYQNINIKGDSFTIDSEYMSHFSENSGFLTEIDFEDPRTSMIRPIISHKKGKSSDASNLRYGLNYFWNTTNKFLIPKLESNGDSKTSNLVMKGLESSMYLSTQFREIREKILCLVDSQEAFKEYSLNCGESTLTINGTGSNAIIESPDIAFPLCLRNLSLYRAVPRLFIADKNISEDYIPESRNSTSPLIHSSELLRMVNLMPEFLESIINLSAISDSKGLAMRFQNNLIEGLSNSKINASGTDKRKVLRYLRMQLKDISYPDISF